MKKLILMSLFALSTIFSFAGNGEKEIANYDFKGINITTHVLDNSNDLFEIKHQYQIVIWRSFWDPVSGNGSSYGQVAIASTPCFTEAEAENFRAGIEAVYQSMPAEPNTSVWAVKEIIMECM